MSDIDLMTAIKAINKTAHCRIIDENIDTIEWFDGVTPLKKSDILAKQSELQDDYDSNQYQRDRFYPELGEQLDMLFHDMTSCKGNKNGEWYKAIAKVKSDNPK